MGATNSHEVVSQVSDSPPAVKPNHKSRVLPFDPRSPTTEITRTPIVVNKTPENALQDPFDPRSPTVGIDRTPLNTLAIAKAGNFPAKSITCAVNMLALHALVNW